MISYSFTLYTLHFTIYNMRMFKKIKKSIKNFIKPTDKDTTIQWSLYGRVWREIGKPYWKWLVAGALCTLVAAGAEGFTVTLVGKVVNNGFIEKNLQNLYIVAFQIVGAFSFKGIFGYAKTLIMTRAGLLAATNLRRRIYRHMLEMPLRHFQGGQTGVMMNYFTVQAGAVLNLVTGTIISTIHNLATLIIMVGIMIYTAPQMVALLLFMVPAILVPLVIITRKRRSITRKDFAATNDSTAHINQSIQGIRTIQSFSSEVQESDKMNKIEDYRIKQSYKSAQLGGIQTPLLEIMISIGLGMALIVGGHFITNGIITMGDFVAFILALTAAYKPAKAVTGVNGGIQVGLIAAEQLFDFLDMKPEITDAPDAKILAPGPMQVELRNVSFAYNQADGTILHNVSLNVPAGKSCALVGPSGGGKSTIFNLIERFYDPQKGKVLINDVDIKKYTLSSLRENIADVSQDVFLFNGSVADNIKYGTKRNISQAEIETAARAANAHEFIENLPRGYKTNVGERGSMLSGGQKQRIAIARAILKDAPILLLDEATSALDTQSEKLIQSALSKLMRGRTTFVIAHRLSTILDADIICVIKDGQIVEQGTDAELCALGGEYKKLRDIQFLDSKDPKKHAPASAKKTSKK